MVLHVRTLEGLWIVVEGGALDWQKGQLVMRQALTVHNHLVFQYGKEPSLVKGVQKRIRKLWKQVVSIESLDNGNGNLSG